MPAYGAPDARSSAHIMMEEMAPASFTEEKKLCSVLSGDEVLAVRRPGCLAE